jgi:hypothetical protein
MLGGETGDTREEVYMSGRCSTETEVGCRCFVHIPLHFNIRNRNNKILETTRINTKHRGETGI